MDENESLPEPNERRKEILQDWFRDLAQKTDRADREGRYVDVEHYDLQRQILTVLERALNAIERDPYYLRSQGLSFKIYPDLVAVFNSAEQILLREIIESSG